MKINTHRSLRIQASKNENSRTLLAAVIVLIVIVAAVSAVAYHYLSISFTTRNLATQTPTPQTPTPSLPSSPGPGSTITPFPSTPKPPSTPNSPASPPPAPTLTIPKYSLSEAISAGYVEANITGTSGIGAIFGASSGDSIILNIKRLVSYTIEIEAIPTGTLLVPASGNIQNMAVLNLKGISEGFMYRIRGAIILDSPNATQYLFSAYCVNFNKDNPSSSTAFTQNGLADSNVLKIYSVLNQLPESVTGIAAIQTAVFVVSDNISRSELQKRFSSGVAEIQNARTILEKAGIDISNSKLFTQ
jgi:hypothetical protein